MQRRLERGDSVTRLSAVQPNIDKLKYGVGPTCPLCGDKINYGNLMVRTEHGWEHDRCADRPGERRA